MDSPRDPEDRVARAMAAVAAFHERKAAGEGEPVAEFLAGCGDLAELVEPMLDLAFSLGQAPPPPSVPGDAPELERFGQFRLLSRLGQGGMGTVHLAIDESLGRRVALKQIRPENLGSAQARARFEREARTVSRVDHPNLCQVFYTGEEAGTPYLVMQFVEGETLRDKIQRARTGEGPLLAPSGTESTGSDSSAPSTRDEFHAIVTLMEKVARALHHAHEQGLVHRDVKPGNVMIRDDGEPVVLDFGLVREEDTDLTLTETSQQLGTPLYMAPEQIVGGGGADHRTDVYALGATLYECLTLQPPFAGETRHELFDHILKEEPQSASKVNRAVPKDLAVIAAKAMEKDPRRRYQSALELAADLERVRQLQPIRARRAGPVYRLQRWTRRNPVAALLIVTITAGLGLSLFLLRERDAAMDLATKNLDNFLRLGIRTRLDALQERSESLFPAWPANEEALEDWVAEARRLAAELPDLKDALAELRADARPRTDEERDQDRNSHPVRKQMDVVRSGREEYSFHLSKYPPDAPEDLRAEVEKEIAYCDEQLAELEMELDEPWAFRFADPSDQFLHGALVSVVDDLEAFLETRVGRKGLLLRMEGRQAWASSIHERSIEQPAAIWAEAIDAVAASDGARASRSYGGLEISPQMGLVPIGMDSASGLWEFHHPASGEAPERGEDGRFVVADETGMIFVLIPGGTFWMGAQNDDPAAPGYDEMVQDPLESPAHEVTIGPYFLSKYEMTQAQWRRLSGGERPSSFWAGAAPVQRVMTYTHPVESVSWTECEELMQLHGLCLPTEARWEFACRGGTTTRWWTGDDRESLVGTINIADKNAAPFFPSAAEWPELDDEYITHAPVDMYEPNPFGLYNVHSNVSEWCRDPFARYDQPVKPGDGLRHGEVGSDKMVRGASFRDTPYFVRSAMRFKLAAVAEDEYTGLRACREILD